MAQANKELAPKKEKKRLSATPPIAQQQTIEKERYPLEAEYLRMEFDPFKKYVFELATENIERELPVIGIVGQKARPEPHKRFKPFQNIVFTSQVIWKGQRRIVRYYDGCSSIFADEQPKEREDIEIFIKSTKPRNFLEGKFGCYGDERMLLLYLNICSWNANSPFRTRSADAIFVSVDPTLRMSKENKKLEEIDKAMQLAKEATVKKMMIHASYLEIPLFDFDSENELTPEEVRVLYKKEAIKNAANFIESYGNKSIEMKYYIEKALTEGLISNKFNPNKATWRGSNNVICDISGMKSNEAIGQKLFEFSQLQEGEDFAVQLKALFD